MKFINNGANIKESKLLDGIAALVLSLSLKYSKSEHTVESTIHIFQNELFNTVVYSYFFFENILYKLKLFLWFLFRLFSPNIIWVLDCMGYMGPVKNKGVPVLSCSNYLLVYIVFIITHITKIKGKFEQITKI